MSGAVDLADFTDERARRADVQEFTGDADRSARGDARGAGGGAGR